MISFIKSKFLYSCLVCGCKDISKLQTMRIGRKNMQFHDSVTSFDVCTDCIAEMYLDLKKEVDKKEDKSE